jgi:hypothetical protein
MEIYRCTVDKIIAYFQGTGQKPPNIEIIIESYYICFILMVILKDILKELKKKIRNFKNIFSHILFIIYR